MKYTIIRTMLAILLLITAAAPLKAANTCLLFSEISEYVSLNSSYTFGTAFTQEMWVYPGDEVVRYHCLLGNRTITAIQRPPSIYQYGLKVHCGFGDGSAWNSFITDNNVLTKNSWNHLAVTFNGNYYTLYVNGTSVYTTQAFAGKVPYSTTKLTGFGHDNEVNCKIEEVRVWNTTRTPSEVQNNRYKELLGTEPGLVAYYQMNEGSGTVVNDKTANGNHGTLVNMDNSNWQISNNYSVDLSSDPTGGGTTSGSGNYWPGTTAALSATASSIFNFVNWTKDSAVISTTAAFNYTVPAENSTLVANFAVIPFTQISTGLISVGYSSVDWGDYDNDSDLDFLWTGADFSANYNKISFIYRNHGDGLFLNLDIVLPGVRDGSVAWGDYDNDGDLDFLLTGATQNPPNYNPISKIYRNNGNSTFSEITAGLPGVCYSSVAWADYDNDGDLDILLTGSDLSNNRISQIYRNNGNGSFTDINAGLTGVWYSSVAWGDYDNDGDPDILLTGWDASLNRISKIYRNDNGAFIDIIAGLTGVQLGSVAWGDYDNDGDPDILLTGYTGSYISKIYRNDNGLFTDIVAGLTGVYSGSAAWGDYDNDGDPDILLTGYSVSGNISKIYRNNGNSTFTDINTGLTGIQNGSADWGDYDNDGDLDILLTGEDASLNRISKIYRNNSLTANTAPAAPANLSAQTTADSIIFSWDKTTDTETTQNGLSYNLYIRSGSLYAKSPMSNITDGYRKVVNTGNANQMNSWTIKNLPEGKYYWSVQAVDNTFAGSAFAAEKSFFTGTLAVPSDVAISELTGDVTVSWSAVEFADSYKIYTCEDPYGTFDDVSASGTFNGTSWTAPGSGDKLFYYVVAVVE